jgi:iron complex outermembrane receptor protein
MRGYTVSKRKNSINRFYLRGFIAFLSFVFATSPGITQAQTENIFIEEIVVTARKREESVQDIPISITAFSANKMKALHIDDSSDIAFFTPNFTWNSEFGKTSPQVYLRGIGSNNFMANNTGPVAVYQDNVYHGPNVTHAFAAFDLDRVEVLKGPQGTLYGRNSTGGLVNFISRKPTIGGDVSGELGLEFGDYQTINVGGAIDIPFSETMAGRVAFAVNRNEGFWDNNNPASGVDHSGRIEDYSARAQLLFKPDDALDVLLNFHVAISEPDTEPFKAIGTACPAGVTPFLSKSTGSRCPDIFGVRDTGDVFETFGSDDREEVDTYGGFVQIEYHTDLFSITSLTAFDTVEHRRYDDADGSANLQFHGHFLDEFDYFSQELRISGGRDKLKWHAGVYYYNESYDGLTLFDIFDIDPNAFGVDKEFDTESYAFFGQVDYSLTDKLSFNAGFRWSYEEKTIDKFDVVLYNATGRALFIDSLASLTGINTPTIIDIRTDRKKDFDELTWRFSMDYALTDDVLFYASVSRGFKGGEINGFPGATEPTSIIAPEILDAVEAGIKSTVFNGSVVLNAAVFYYDYQDQQVSTFSDQGGNPVAVLDNATSSEIWGIDIDINWAPTDQFYISGAIGYVDANYGDFFSPAAGQLSNNRIAFTPELEATLLARYEWNLSNGSVLSLQGDIQYTDDIFFQPTNVEYLHEDAYTLFNASLRYSLPGDKWSFTLFGKNLSDKEYFSSGYDLGPPLFPSQIKVGPPRYIGVKIDYAFDG